MKETALVIVGFLSACTPPQAYNYAAVQSEQANAVAAGELTEVDYYPQPNFKSDRFYKVEDQYGCKWWITSGRKFDQEYIVLRDDGKPDCPSDSVSPAQETALVDKDGNYHSDIRQ